MFLDTYTLFYVSVIEMICFPSVFCTVRLGFWVFPRNRLAVWSLPPGGSSGMSVCSCFGLSRLAAMSSCLAARPWLCSVWWRWC